MTHCTPVVSCLPLLLSGRGSRTCVICSGLTNTMRPSTVCSAIRPLSSSAGLAAGRRREACAVIAVAGTGLALGVLDHRIADRRNPVGFVARPLDDVDDDAAAVVDHRITCHVNKTP